MVLYWIPSLESTDSRLAVTSLALSPRPAPILGNYRASLNCSSNPFGIYGNSFSLGVGTMTNCSLIYKLGRSSGQLRPKSPVLIYTSGRFSPELFQRWLQGPEAMQLPLTLLNTTIPMQTNQAQRGVSTSQDSRLQSQKTPNKNSHMGGSTIS